MPGRFVSIFVAIAFVLSGAVSAGAHLRLCADVDGTVHLELLSQECCEAQGRLCDEDADEAGGLPSNPVVADDCGPCGHVRLTFDTVQDLTHRGTTRMDGSCADAQPVSSFAAVDVHVAALEGPSPPQLRFASRVPLPVSVPSTVLRC